MPWNDSFLAVAFAFFKLMLPCTSDRVQKAKEEEVLPGGDGSSVMVPALVIPAPVVPHQIHVQIVGCNLALAPFQLLHCPLTHEEWSSACKQSRVAFFDSREKFALLNGSQ